MYVFVCVRRTYFSQQPGAFIIDRANTFRIAFCVSAHSLLFFHISTTNVAANRYCLLIIFFSWFACREIVSALCFWCLLPLLPLLVVEKSLICVLFTITKLPAVFFRFSVCARFACLSMPHYFKSNLYTRVRLHTDFFFSLCYFHWIFHGYLHAVARRAQRKGWSERECTSWQCGSASAENMHIERCVCVVSVLWVCCVVRE